MEQKSWHQLRIIDKNDVLLSKGLAEEESSDRLISKVYLDGFFFIFNKTLVVEVNWAQWFLRTAKYL